MSPSRRGARQDATHRPSESSPARGARWLEASVVAALVLASLYFVWRAVWRGHLDSGDLTYGWAAAQALIRGLNPYDGAVLTDIVLTGGGPVVPTAIGHGVYFPASLPLFLPIALATWPVAKLLALGLNIGAALFIALGLVHLLGWKRTAPRSLGLIAFVLALGPVHATIASGQTAVLATAGLVAAMLLERSGRGVWAGVLYGLATAVKVQIGLPFVAYLVWRRRWATAAAAGLVVAGLTLISVLRMHTAGVPWYESWLTNLAWLTGPEGTGNPSPENPDRLSLINLQYPLLSVIDSPALADLVTLVAVGAVAATMVWLIRGRDPRQELLALSIVAVLTLLVTYHRYYDAVLLAVPIAWAVSAIGTVRWRQGVIVLLLCVDFVVPILGALLTIQRRQLLPTWLTDGLLWQTLVLPLHVWALVLMVLVLLWAAAKGRLDA